MSSATRVSVVAALLAATTLTACAPRGSDSVPTGESTVSDPLAGSMAEARAAGADQSQIDIFANGTVTYEEYESAILRYLACAEDAGFTTTVNGTRPGEGVTLLDYTISMNTASGLSPEAEGQCYTLFAEFVDRYWQAGQPESIAFNERREAALEPLLRECLTGYGVDVPADASFRDLTVSSSQLTQRDNSKNCMDDIGYMSWQG